MKNKSFCLDPSLIGEMAERYHEDKEGLWAHDARTGRRYLFRKPFCRERIERHIAKMVEESFWASLKTEEHRYHDFTLIYSGLEEDNRDDDSFVFKNLEFNAENVVKLAPAVHSSTRIIVGPMRSRRGNHDELYIVGFTRRPLRGDSTSLSIRTIGPGQAVISYANGFKVGLDGSKIDFVNEEMLHDLVPSFFGLESDADLKNEAFLKHQFRRSDAQKIVLAIRAHGHGGTLVIVPNNNRTWKESVHMDRLRFAGLPYDGIKRDLEERDKAFGMGDLAFERADKSLELLAQLTAADGATVVSQDLTVLAFGAQIKRKEAPRSPKHTSTRDGRIESRTLVSSPFSKSKPQRKRVSELGGTRHRSAAEFVLDQRSARCIVVSADGGISLYRWDDGKERWEAGEKSDYRSLEGAKARQRGALCVTKKAEFLLLGNVL
jgi:hypothetical protein